MSNILLIHCGGTFAKVPSFSNGYKTKSCSLAKLIINNRNIANRISPVCTSHRCKNQLVTFITPPLRNNVFATVDIFEFPNIDSSNARVEHYSELAKVISELYDCYDGFVIVHGTDMLPYAASFLSFMIEGPCIPIVFTGSIMPMVVEGSDAEGNLIGAIESCLLVDTSGVYIYFNGFLHNGAKTTKISSFSFDCYFSTNPVSIKDLAENSKRHLSKRKERDPRPVIYTKLSNKVGIVKIFPTIHFFDFECAFKCYKAVVLETYGSGTFPLNRPELLKMIEEFIAEGGIVVSTSQCAHGRVSDFYETNNVIFRLGALSARNMTTEAVYAKLSFLLANHRKDIFQLFPISICGEIDDETIDPKKFTFNNS